MPSSAATVLLDALSERAGGWWPDGPAHPKLTVVREDIRAQSVLLHLAVSGFAGPDRTVVAKAVFPGATAGVAAGSRPRLGPESGFEHHHAFEANALRLAFDRIEDARDPQLTAARVLDHLPDQRTLVLERLDGAPLRSALLGARPPVRSARAAGRWIAHFHALRPEGVETRRATPQDVAGQIERAAAFVGDSELGGIASAVARRLDSGVVSASLGLGHGDVAPRNVLVDAAGRIALLDPLGRMLVPVAEDVAAFGVSVRVGALAAWPPRARALSDAFRAGYEDVGGPVDRPLFAVCHAAVVLDRLAAEQERPWRGVRGVAARAFIARALRAERARVLVGLRDVA